LTDKFEHYISKIETIQRHYEDIKSKLLFFKERNRILVIRIDNDESDYSEDEYGCIVKRKRVEKKFI
jgi:hypothetical protein